MSLTHEELVNYWQSGLGAAAIGEPAEARYEYGAFNDEAVLGPKFAAGELPDSFRTLVEEPLYEGTLWSVTRWARLANEERARGGKMDAYGPVVVKRRTRVATPWTQVSYAEVEEALLR